MTLLSKTTLLAASVATLVSTAPAVARDYYDRGGISAGEVIAGALIIGGIAAVASASSNNGRNRDYGRDYDRGYDRNYDRGNGGYDRQYGYDNNDRYDRGSRYAVEQCVRAAQREANRYGRARVTDVTRIERVYGGYEVRGRLVAEQRDYDRRGYGNGWERYGYNYDRYNSDYNHGSFSCVTRYDQVADIRVRGLNG